LERLQKFISQAGVASRRAAEQLIRDGKVSVNGKVVTELGTKVDPLKDKVSVEGKLIKQEKEQVYFILNKPKGYYQQQKMIGAVKTVLDLLPGVKERIYPVGRLDNNTEGLLVLTNDGELMNQLLHPK